MASNNVGVISYLKGIKMAPAANNTSPSTVGNSQSLAKPASSKQQKIKNQEQQQHQHHHQQQHLQQYDELKDVKGALAASVTAKNKKIATRKKSLQVQTATPSGGGTVTSTISSTTTSNVTATPKKKRRSVSLSAASRLKDSTSNNKTATLKKSVQAPPTTRGTHLRLSVGTPGSSTRLSTNDLNDQTIIKNSSSFSEFGGNGNNKKVDASTTTVLNSKSPKNKASLRVNETSTGSESLSIAMDLAQPPSQQKRLQKEQQKRLSLHGGPSEHEPVITKKKQQQPFVKTTTTLLKDTKNPSDTPKTAGKSKVSPKRTSVIRKMKVLSPIVGSPGTPSSSAKGKITQKRISAVSMVSVSSESPTAVDRSNNRLNSSNVHPLRSPLMDSPKRNNTPKLSYSTTVTDKNHNEAKSELRKTVSTDNSKNQQQQLLSFPKRNSLDQNMKLKSTSNQRDSPKNSSINNNDINKMQVTLNLLDDGDDNNKKVKTLLIPVDDQVDDDMDGTEIPSNQRKSRSFLPSKTGISSTCHAKIESQPNPIRRLSTTHKHSPLSANTDNKMDRHRLSGSSYAGDIDNLYLPPRPSAFLENVDEDRNMELMGNHSDFLSETRRRVSSTAADDSNSDKINLLDKAVSQARKRRDTVHHHNHHSSVSPKIEKTSNSLIFFGTPLLPIDIAEECRRKSKLNLMHHKDALQVLEQIKKMRRHDLKVQLMDSSNGGSSESPLLKNNLSDRQQHDKLEPKQDELKCVKLIKTAGTATSATLSMTGYKGGPLENQVNHDRSLIVSPFYLRNHGHSAVSRRLMGVFDGHAENGSKFAEHCQQKLPYMLSRKLSEAFRKAVEDISAGIKKNEDEIAITKRVLVETFLAMDDTSPKDASGGCTASVVYQQGQKVYIANAGDSRSFVAVYRKNYHSRSDATNQRLEKNDSQKPTATALSPWTREKMTRLPVKVIYMSREDKPDLPGERNRLESCGGEVVPSEKNKSSKIKFNNTRPGKPSATLSMSRSIGDHLFTSVGVIPDPIVNIIDIKDLVENEISDGGIDDVCIFAASMSDGMMVESLDDAEAVAEDLAPSLFQDNAPHPLTACQSVIDKVAAVWDKRNKGKFRDDITIAVTVLRSPPVNRKKPV